MRPGPRAYETRRRAPHYGLDRRPARGARQLMNDDGGPSFLVMIGFVALVVATVILVFFGIGYGLGRLFL